MRAGTIVRLPDGREGTAVYNGLDGVGIKWGRHLLTPEDLREIESGGPFTSDAPLGYEWFPDAMLRDAYRGCDPALEYVGAEFEIVSRPEVANA